MKDKNFNNAKEIKVLVDGKEIVGRYIVERKVVTVTSAYGQRSTQLGGSPAETIARMLLRELSDKN